MQTQPRVIKTLPPRILQTHERKGVCLLAERERFMGLLGKERLARVHLENFACSLVQAAYRGYLLRKRCELFTHIIGQISSR